MKPLGLATKQHRTGLRHLLFAAVLASGFGGALRAEPPPASRLPVFGTAGAQFDRVGKDSHVVKGWLPKDWLDNSKWAAVNATYTKLDDPPEKGIGAVRIEAKNIDSGQLQLTTFEGEQKYTKGAKYAVTGWIRSATNSGLRVGAREESPERPFLDDMYLSGAAEWRRFEFVFAPEKDCNAIIMLVMKEPGTVDLAGLSVVEKK